MLLENPFSFTNEAFGAVTNTIGASTVNKSDPILQ
jgi:hypothetical protein